MLRRDIRHSLRNLTMTLTPTILLALFVYVFGNTMDAGLGGVTHSGAYIDYVAPAIIIMTVV